MTCEVVVMNRLGIVLAADSAITFQNNSEKGATTSFSTGANKIFQLSNHEPVGAMIFNSASLNEIPWELVLKSFRSNLSDSKFSTINEYSDALTQFIINNKKLFPEAHLEEHTRKRIAAALFTMLNWSLQASPELKDKSRTPDQHRESWNAFIKRVKALLKKNSTANKLYSY